MGRTSEDTRSGANLRHSHLLLRADTPKHITSRLSELCLQEHLRDLVRSIDMQILIPPAIRFSQPDGNTGFTGLVGITTSHISFHHWDTPDPGILQLDVFSCRPFALRRLVETVVDFWEGEIREAVMITRFPHFHVRELSASELLSDTSTSDKLTINA